MKKYFLLSCFCALAMVLPAQKNMYVWQGNIPTEFAVADVDSVTFADALLEPVLPEGALSGLFSVSATKQVRFSQGNLQYTQSTATWSFAAHQYDYIGTDNIEGGEVSSGTYGNDKMGYALADKIDLFGWSGSTATALWGIITSTDDNDYSGEFMDWGLNIGDGETWRTLTLEEWFYLLSTRVNADDLQGVAKIDLGDGMYANGLVLLPDSWQAPAGITFKSGFSGASSVAAYGEYQTFTLSEWEVLEGADAVFLPASGDRSGVEVSSVQYYGVYWSATPLDEFSAYFLFFDPDNAYMGDYSRSPGQSVRLVQDAE